MPPDAADHFTDASKMVPRRIQRCRAKGWRMPAGAEGYDLAGAIAEKLAYNQQRADHRLENRAKPGGKAY